jgi:hypothetical protein
MARPRSRDQIIKKLKTERARLEKILASVKREDMLQPGVVGEWSVKDVLAHLADWEAHMLVWVDAARSGDAVKSPDPGLSWKQLDIFNERIYQSHRDQPLDEVIEYFHSAHNQFMQLVEAMPDEEMLGRGFYAFTAKSAIYDWLRSYANHDSWGSKEIKKWLQDR